MLITHLPAKVELQRNPELYNKQFLITHQFDGEYRVLDFSSQIKGILPGTPLQEALSQYTDSVLIDADEIYYIQVFDNITEKLFGITPFIEKNGLGCVFLDIHNIGSPYGNYENIVSSLLGSIPKDFSPRIGVSESKFPAYIAAIKGEPGIVNTVTENVSIFLKNLSVNHLPISCETRAQLQTFGIHTLGQVASISLGAMQAQFGSKGKLLWELSKGIDNRPFVPAKHREVLTYHLTFPSPTISIFAIMSAIEVLLDKLLSSPFIKGKYLRSVYVHSNILNRQAWSHKIAFKSPINRKEIALLVLRNTFERTGIPGPLEDMRLTVSDLTGEFGIQASLLEDVRKNQQLKETLSQLETRLGARVPIYRVMEIERWSRMPERRHALVEFVP